VPTVPIVPSGCPLGFVRYAGAFWAFIQNAATAPAEIQVWQSTDGGLTWNLQDGASDPFSLGWIDYPISLHFDGSHTVTFWYDDGNHTGHLYLQQFDLSLQTWGPQFALQAPSPHVWGTSALFQQSNGNFVGLVKNLAINPEAFFFTVWDGVSWSAYVDVCAGAEALPGFSSVTTNFLPFASAAMDSSDVLHVIYSTASSDPTWDNRFFYQEITSGGALQNFQEFPGQVPPTQDLNPFTQDAGPAANMLILGSVIYWAVIRNNPIVGGPLLFPSVYVGSPLINPVWSERANLDPGATSVQSPNGGAGLFYDSLTSQIYLDFCRFAANGTDSQVQSVISSDGFATSQAVTLSDSGTGGPVVQYFAPFLLFSSVYILAGSSPGEGLSLPAAFFGVFPPAPPAISPLKITFRGVKVFRKCDPEPELGDMPVLPPVRRAW